MFMNIPLFFISLFLIGTLFLLPLGIVVLIISLKYKGRKKKYSKKLLEDMR